MELSAKEEQKLVVENMDIVRARARKYQNQGLDLEDLVQIGCIALLYAIRDWEPSGGASLRTYAGPRITERLKRAIGVAHQRPRKHARPTSRRTPWNLSTDDALAVPNRSVSMDVSNEGQSSLHETLPSSVKTPEEQYEEAEAASNMEKALDTVRLLTPKERAVIEDRFMNDLSLVEIGRRQGVTRERARQIQNKALSKIEKVLRSCG